ncbi:hypothetical protein [Nocardia altamirensis]|uniref:hypothetical protein n=1 Tax=Nocardia altamirensis TaxID=472158 RepID=UPI0008406278|nr:hypothetical protein [Nocardia altamirensis]
MGLKMYLDLLASASLVDHSVWTDPNVLASTLEYSAKKKKSSSGLIIGGICCLLVVVAIVGGIYLITKRKKNQ